MGPGCRNLYPHDDGYRLCPCPPHRGTEGFLEPFKSAIGLEECSANYISDVLKRLAQFGILSAELLPSTNSLIPLFALHCHWGGELGYNFNKALRWFLLANRDGRYSGSAITSLNEDVRAVSEATSFGNAIENLSKRLRVSSKIEAEEFCNRYDRAGNRFLRLVLYLLIFGRDAPDWVDGIRIGYDKTGSPITTGFEAQWHHIYPRSVLRNAGIENDLIHPLANITVLNERTNVNKLAYKETWRYIEQFHISSEALLAHLIPESFARTRSKEQWGLERYEDFLAERSWLLAEEANRFLEGLEK